MRWLIPRLSDFQQHYPHVPIHILIGGGAVDFAQTPIDLAIRRNDFVINPRDTQTFLADEWIAPVVHPQLLQSKPTSELCQLHTRTRPDAWETWRVQYSKYLEKNSSMLAGQAAFNGAQSLWFEHFYLTLQAASAQLGVAIASIYMVGEELNNGTLSAPSPFIRDGSHYILLSRQTAEDDGKKLFTDWLIEQFKQYQQQYQRFLCTN